MKRIGLLTLAISLSIFQIQAQTNKAKIDMVFDKTVGGITSHDFGSIVYGANGKVDFTFANKGTNPLVITDVKSSCGCTIPTWTKEPVAPGQIGTITIEYNTTLPGVFNKTVAVYSNANNSPVRIEIRGKVNSQPSDLAPGSADQQKKNEAARKLEEVNGGAKQNTETAREMDAADSVAHKKALQRAAYEARTKKAQEQKTTGTKTGTNTKAATGTTTKKK